jgi:hypothetical protein
VGRLVQLGIQARKARKDILVHVVLLVSDQLVQSVRLGLDLLAQQALLVEVLEVVQQDQLDQLDQVVAEVV